MAPISVLLVADRGLVAAGLESLIAARQDMVLAGTAGNCNEGLIKTCLIPPDLVLLHAANCDSRYLLLCDEICRQSPTTRILVVGSHSSLEAALGFLSHGATGYVVDTTPIEQLIYDIRRVALGEPVVRGMVVGTPSSGTLSIGPATSGHHIKSVGLSNSELNVLRLLARGKTNKEIARTLSLSLATVKWHLSRIYSKLGVDRRSEAVIYALRMGLDQSA